ncbi:unnamed protein product [Parascedosporium putredinis]|uniref:Ribosome biogenesis protein NOP53 n=1 Tax=Parascedosporium putredinis TaxID=1442378 RepID=A0A9P1M990_9PEZI|nr:unnamed protein product [Parascedosporium putredinis]CAI7991494.1 unnamed protein product [Parascedosporium putredinis]
MPVLEAQAGSRHRPQQHKQPSRKGKKAWRKNVDISEVEHGLVELNEEIIRGGPIAERDAEDIFAIDVVGDQNLKKQLPKRLRTTLKSDEIISQRSRVPALSTRKRTTDRIPDGSIEPKRLRRDYVSHKEIRRLKQVADGIHDQTVTIEDATYDIWDSGPPLEAVSSAPSFVPQCYNPAFSDYEKRLTDEGTKAVESERKRLVAKEEEKIKREAAARSAAEAEAAEAKAELSEWDEDSEWEGFQSGTEETKMTKRPERKTKAQRNKIKRYKEEERKKKLEAAAKRKHRQLDALKQLTREATKQAGTSVLAIPQLSDSESEGDDDQLRRRKLGKAKIPEKDLELVLPDELQDSLRLLRPEGNLLRDRYRNLLVRGKLESRKHIPFKKQAKGKMTEKWTHKDFTLF